jgi:uncharacterized protein YbgA (DUF1722 family)
LFDPERVPEAERSTAKLVLAILPDDEHAPAGLELLARWSDWIEVDRSSLAQPAAFEAGRAFDSIDGIVLPSPSSAASSEAAPLERMAPPKELPRIDWQRLADENERDHFFEQALGRRRIRLLFHPSWSHAELVAFNTRERHRVIAHDPKRHRLIGRLVSKAKDHAREDLEREIAELYSGALARPVTRRKHANVLENAMEILEPGASADTRIAMVRAFEAYTSGEERLWPVLELLRDEARQQGMIGLANQSYLDPDPIERALRFSPE